MAEGNGANILLIEADQWSARCLGFLGHPCVRTPNLDRLAAEGAAFTNHYCNHPLCLPSRVSLMCGQYPATHKQYGFSGLCDRRTPFMQVAFKQAGYATGASGKFHIHSIPPEQWCFDYAAPTLLGEIDMARPAGNHYMAYCAAHGVPCPNDQQHCGNPWGLKKPHSSHAGEDMFWMHKHSVQSDVPVEHSLETYTADRCLEFLREYREKNRPFFYWLTFDRPHYPTTLPKEWHEKVDARRAYVGPVPTVEQLASLPPSVFQDYANHVSLLNAGPEVFRFIVATYYTLCEFIDDQVGRVLRHLREAGLDESTTIVFTADHGDEAGSRGLYEKFNGVSSEEICRAPLLVRPAPKVAGRACRGLKLAEPVESVDVFPTLCALAGLPAPGGLEGADLSRALLEGRPLDPRRPVFIEEVQSRSVVRDGWKLVYDILPDERQLYDLNCDPYCFSNLYGRAEFQPRRVEAKRLLLAFLMQRFHGPFTSADVEHVRRALDPQWPETGLHISPMHETNNHRAACTVRGPSCELFVPFYDGDSILLFASRKAGDRHGYRKRDEALPFDPTQAEMLLDRALDRAFEGIHGLSNTRNWPKCEYARPSLEAARRLYAKWNIKDGNPP